MDNAFRVDCHWECHFLCGFVVVRELSMCEYFDEYNTKIDNKIETYNNVIR